MMKPNRPNISKGGNYPPEFREEAVRYWLSSGQTLKQVASDLGVSPECLRTWLRQMESVDPVTSDPVECAAPTIPSTPNSNVELALSRAGCP